MFQLIFSIKVEDLVTLAGDFTPIQVLSDKSIDEAETIQFLRRAMNKLSKEFDETIKNEKDKVIRLGGLYVIGTTHFLLIFSQIFF
jgi:preprotein translocase subunit SecA